jgi:acyl-CoA thioesterase FadM
MDADRLDVYGVGYTEGYYDGFYDQSRGLKFDPYYYVFDYDDLETSEERRGDVSRSRAERQREASGERARRMQESEAQYYLETDKIRGTLSGMERVSVNQRNDHMTLRLSFEDHDDVIADFGPRIRKDDLPVVVGDRVTITGRMRSSGGHDVLVAHSLRADGQTMRIMRTAQQKMRAAQIKQREQPDPINLRERRRSARMDKVDPDRHQESLETLRGVVQSVELVEREAADKRQIAELTLEDGRTRLVDLGRTPNKIGIETGDRIRIRGRFKQLGQQRVFVAQRCFVNDEPVQLARDH